MLQIRISFWGLAGRRVGSAWGSFSGCKTIIRMSCTNDGPHGPTSTQRKSPSKAMPCLQTACDMAQGASIIIVVSTILVFLPLALLREGLERSIRQHWSGAAVEDALRCTFRWLGGPRRRIATTISSIRSWDTTNYSILVQYTILQYTTIVCYYYH